MNVNIKKPIIEQIETMTNSICGFSDLEQLYSIFLLLCANINVCGNVIEIGSWCGKTSSVLGLAAQLTKVEKVICIDLFPNKNDWFKNADKSYSFNVTIDGIKYNAYTEQTAWEEPYNKSVVPVYKHNENLLNIFLKNMKNLGYENFIFPVRGDSSVIKHYVPTTFRCKFAFIDGDHGYNAVYKDIKNIEPYLVSGALLCFDDAFTSFDGVNKALQELIIDNPEYDFYQQLTRKLFVARRR